MQLENHWADGACSISTFGNAILIVSRQTATMEHLRQIRRVSRLQASHWKQDVRSVTVMEESSVALRVSDEIRNEGAALTNEFVVAAAAVVLEGSGFGLAAMRTFIAGMYLLARNPTPRRITSNVEEGVRWVLERTATTSARPMTADELTRAIAQTRAALR